MQCLNESKHAPTLPGGWRNPYEDMHGTVHGDRRGYIRKMLDAVMVQHTFTHVHMEVIGQHWKEQRRYTELSQAQKEFDELAAQWRDDTGHLSSIPKIVIHPAYQKIMTKGQRAVPFILHALQTKPGYWYWALEMITGENPVAANNAGHIRTMKRAWLEWGKERGLI